MPVRADRWLLGCAMGAALAGSSALAEEGTAPIIPPNAEQVEHDRGVFQPDPSYEDKPYDPEAQLDIYGGKRAAPTPRAAIEWGREIYTSGPLQESYTFLGDKNPVAPNFYVYGDFQSAVAYTDNGAKELGQVAVRLSLDIDFQITSTERIHAFMRPLDSDGQFTRCEIFGDNDGGACEDEVNGNVETIFFEGDVGPIAQGLSGEYNAIELPFAVGFVPLLMQNGIWYEDAAVGGAFTIPFRNSATFDISNMDITAFAMFDEVDSQAFLNGAGKTAQNNVQIYGITAFIEASEGYWELGYGYSDADDALDQFSYHNATVAFAKRYFNRLSNSTRLIVNFGQDTDGATAETADGFAILSENSLVTGEPAVLVPYLNLFAGFHRPQGLAQQDRGLLKNTGLNFEFEAITQFPRLDDTARDTFGGALGLEYLFNLDQQIVVEVATNQIIGEPGEPTRPAFDNEYGFGIRYQRPITAAWILRADAMYGLRERVDDLAGFRLELRRKF
ncbi:MAG: hypothetical protein EXQ94_03240 [Alphaproteobacteria bacterium]|nr:hypothetical protein [Alphaproteobacteria bacterium]